MKRSLNWRKCISTSGIILSLTCVCLVVLYLVMENGQKKCIKRIAPGADLHGCFFFNQNLQGKDFHGANLTRADLGEADLSGANLQGATLVDVSFKSANLTGANLEGATWKNVDLSQAIGVTDVALSRWMNVPADQLYIILSLNQVHLDSRSEIVKQLSSDLNKKGACEQVGTPGAIDYIPDSKFHPVMLIDDNNTRDHKPAFEANSSIPQWEPMALRYASLVACISPQEDEQVDTCKYDNGYEIKSFVEKRTVVLVSARSGQIVITQVLRGESAGCPNSIEVVNGAANNVHGKSITMDDIKKFLQPFVNPP